MFQQLHKHRFFRRYHHTLCVTAANTACVLHKRQNTSCEFTVWRCVAGPCGSPCVSTVTQASFLPTISTKQLKSPARPQSVSSKKASPLSSLSSEEEQLKSGKAVQPISSSVQSVVAWATPSRPHVCCPGKAPLLSRQGSSLRCARLVRDPRRHPAAARKQTAVQRRSLRACMHAPRFPPLA